MAKDTLDAIFVIDLHNHIAEIESLPDAEVLILGGDITTFGKPEQIAEAIRLAQQKYPRVLALLGNCDPQAAEPTLQELGVALNLQAVAIGPARFLGNSGSNPTPAHTPYEWEDDARTALLAPLAKIPRDGLTTVLVTHAPPYHSGADRLPIGLHVGSQAIARLVDELGSPLVLCGHIHEGEGIFPGQHGSQIVNPGPFSQGKYARIAFRLGKPPRVELQRLQP